MHGQFSEKRLLHSVVPAHIFFNHSKHSSKIDFLKTCQLSFDDLAVSVDESRDVSLHAVKWFRGYFRTTGFGMDKPGAVGVIKKKKKTQFDGRKL